MPGSSTLKGYFHNILKKRCFIREIPDWLWEQELFYSENRDREASSYSKLAALLEEFQEDYDFLAIPPATLKTMSYPQLLSLLCTRDALDDAGLLSSDFDREKAGVFVAATSGCDVAEAQGESFLTRRLFHRLRGLTKYGEINELEALFQRYLKKFPDYPLTPDSLPGRSTHLVAGRIAWAFDLHGPNITIDAACASSLAAIDCGVNSLRTGECDLVISGGVDTWMTADAFVLFSKVAALAELGSFPFEERGDGFVLGEGCGIVILKRLQDALRNDDQIYAVLKNVGSSSDGAGAGITAPQTLGQVRALQRAYVQGTFKPCDTLYVECHGTGTPLGDPTELASLDQFFQRQPEQPLTLGSAKASVGHLRTAAGMAGLFNALIPINCGLLPPQTNFEKPGTGLLKAEQRLTVVQRPTSVKEEVVQTAVSGFGFGGTNFVLVLSTPPSGSRSALVQPEDYLFGTLPQLSGEVAFLFPGQGSQYPGMLSELYQQEEVRPLFEAAESIVEQETGLSLLEALYPSTQGPAQDSALCNTVLAQPALFCVSAALLQTLRSQTGVECHLALGHSLGEYTALYATGAITFEEAVKAVTLRGRIMSQGNGKESSLLCLLGDAERALELVHKMDPKLEIANINSYSQLVVAGKPEDLKEAAHSAKEVGLGTAHLMVDRGFHSTYVSHAVEPMRAHLLGLALECPRVPIPANSERTFYPHSQTGEQLSPEAHQRVVSLLAAQVAEPVDFVSQIELAYEAGIRRFVEVGPRRVLAALVKDILSGKPFQVLSLDEGDRGLLQNLADLQWSLQEPLSFQRPPLTRCRPRNNSLWDNKSETPVVGQSPEEQVRNVVSAVTGYPKSRLGLDVEFEADLGLDSLKLISIVSQLRGSVLPPKHRGFRGLNSIRMILQASESLGHVESAEVPVRCFELRDCPVFEKVEPWDVPWSRQEWSSKTGTLGEVNGDSQHRLYLGRLPVSKELREKLLPGIMKEIQSRAKEGGEARFAVVSYGEERKELLASFRALTAFLRSAHKDVRSLHFSYHHLEIGEVPSELLDRVLGERAIGRWVKSSGQSQVETLLPQASEELDYYSPPYQLRTEDLILVSGGARGIASRVVRELLDSSPSRFLLLGRRPEAPDWVEQYCSQGVEYLCCDISDPEAVRKAQLHDRPISYLFHAAGLGSMCPFLQRDPRDMEEVFRAKNLGLELLVQALSPSKLQGIVQFSSVAAYFGTPGQADYSAANALLDGFQHPQVPVLSIQWTAWADEGMAVRGRVKDIVETTGLQYLSAKEGSRLFAQIFARWKLQGSRDNSVVAVVKGLPKHLESGSPGLSENPITKSRSFNPSPAQEGIYYLEQTYNLEATHHVAWSDRLLGPLKGNLLGDALQRVLDSHQSLRTRFEFEDGDLRAVVDKDLEVDFQVQDVASELEVEALLTSLREEPFALDGQPLIRGRLLKLSEQEHHFLVVAHHIAVDGVSTKRIRKELYEHYSKLKEWGSSADCNPDHYYDVVQNQRTTLESNREDIMTYWKERLSHEPPVLFPRNSRACPTRFPSSSFFFDLEPGLWGAVEASARKANVTPFTLLCAAYAQTLREQSRQDSVIFGIPLQGRTESGSESSVGLFVNTMPVHLNFPGEGHSREELLHEVQQQVYGALEHQDLPFPDLVRELAPSRQPGVNPLFQCVIEYQSIGSEGQDLPELSLEFRSLEAPQQFYDLVLAVLRDKERSYCRVQYRTDVLSDNEVQQLKRHFLGFLKRLTEESLGKEKASPSPYSKCLRKTIPQSFWEQVQARPQALALVEDGAEYSYRELGAKVVAVVGALRVLGVKANSRVAVCLRRSHEFAACVLGILQLGASYLPFDPNDTPARKEQLLKEACAELLVTHGEFGAAKIPTIKPEELLQSPAPDGETVVPTDESDPESMATIVFTSGTSGTPKGVKISHINIQALVQGLNELELGPGKRILHASSPAFDASFFEIWGTLLTGATLILHGERTPTLTGLARTLEREKATTAWFTASLFHLIIDESPSLLSSLDQVLTGGEVLSPRHLERALAHCPRTRFYNGYGPSEGTTFSSLHRIQVGDLNREEGIPIGRPLPFCTLKILGQGHSPVSTGQSGEIAIGGGGLCQGYLSPQDESGRFLPDFDSSMAEKRLYLTGDRGRFSEDGILEFLGRKDRQVKIRGFRVEPEGVERCLLNFEDVLRCAVGSQTDQDSHYLVAYVVLKSASQTTPEELREALTRYLPDYMVPRLILKVKNIPRTVTGKVDWGSLSELSSSRPSYSLILPREPLEGLVAAIWEEALKVRPIGVTDDFTALGGHSLVALRIFNGIERLLKKKLPVSTLFRAPTVEKLAALIRTEGWESNWETIVPIREGGGRPSFYCVHPAGGIVFCYRDLAREFDQEFSFYGIQAKGLDGREPLHESLDQMVIDYVEALVEHQPKGPYYLGGWSSGGAVAFEMAQQLRRRGKDVGLLVLLDTFFPLGSYRKQERILGDVAQTLRDIKRLSSDTVCHAKKVLSSQESLELATVARVTRHASKILLGRVGLAQRHFHESVDTDTVKAQNTLVQRSVQALNSYVAASYDGRTVLFHSRDNNFEGKFDGRLAWKRVVPKLQVIPVAGTHYTFLEQPHCKSLAQQLERAIRDVEAARGAG